MRLKIVLTLLVAAGVFAMGLWLFDTRKENSTADGLSKSGPTSTNQNTERNNISIQPEKSAQPARQLKTGPRNEQPTLPAEEILIKLEEYSREEDPKYLALILAHLTNRNAEIRSAALEATKQFGSRDAIPALKEMAAKTDDPREKVDILDAIEFLELPSLSEIRKEPKK